MNDVLNVYCSDLVFSVSVLEAGVGGHGPQVVRVTADDPWVSLCVVFVFNTAILDVPGVMSGKVDYNLGTAVTLLYNDISWP